MKKIVRYQGDAHLDTDHSKPVVVYAPYTSCFLRYTQHNVRNVDFDDKGYIIRFETKDTIFVRCDPGENSCRKVLRT